MFTKFFILLVIGCTLTLADSRQELRNHLAVRQRGLLSWIAKGTNIVRYPLDILVQTAQGFTDYGSEKVQQATEKYYAIKHQYQVNLDNIKNEIIRKAIGEMHNIVDNLTAVANMTRCEEMKQSNEYLALSGKEALDKLEQELEESVDAELKNLQEQLDDWQIEADNLVKESKKK